MGHSLRVCRSVKSIDATLRECAVNLLAQAPRAFLPPALLPGSAKLCKVLAIDVGANCTRLTQGFGANVIHLPSIIAARERLQQDEFDAVLLVACGYGAQAMAVGEVGSIIKAAGDVPVLVIVEIGDRNVMRESINSGAFDVIVRGVVEPSEVQRRTLIAIELCRLRRERAQADREGRTSPASIVVRERVTERCAVAKPSRIADCVVDHCQEGVMVTNTANEIVQVNDAFTRITGYSEAEVLGRNPRLLSSGRHDGAFYAALWQTLSSDGHWEGEVWNRRKSGEIYAQHLTIHEIHDASQGAILYVAIFSDVNQLKLQAQALDRIAHFDLLTGAANRRLLGERLQQGIDHARCTRRLLAVCYLDLDGFQPINERFGHPVGDQVLIETTRRIESCLCEGDTLARLGGDEFVLLLREIGSHRDACLALDCVLAKLSSPMVISGHHLMVSASIGITIYPGDAESPDILLRHADQAMLLAKQHGRNRYQFFDAKNHHEQQANRELLVELENGLQRGEFVLFYQPKVNLVSGRVWGAEALIRWQHPQRGLLAPHNFLPAVQGTRFESRIGEWVIQTALGQMARWIAAGVDLEVSVNVSAPHLLDEGFVPTLRRLLDAHPALLAHRLELEILESSALNDIEQAVITLAECRELGVRFALDDFGTGFSSLTYFRKLGVETLKIDQSFVRDMLCNPEDRGIVESVIRLAKAFSRGVVAEGVESADCWPVLISLGCECAQGFSVAKPMLAEDMLNWIAQWDTRKVADGV